MVVVTSEQLIAPGLKAITETRFVVSVDLGQSADSTAICVMAHNKTFHVTRKGRVTVQRESFEVRYLQRLPLGLSYVDQVRRIAELYSHEPLNGACDLVIDETGVGRPVGDLFNNEGLRPIRVTITAGDGQSAKGTHRFHVSKSFLISGLDARLHTGELKIASELPEATTLKEELRDFRRHVSAAGRFSYEARTGKHDDLVLAVALALWSFVGQDRPSPVQIGTWGYGHPITLKNTENY